MTQAFNDQAMREAHADALKSVQARNNLPAEEKKADQARTLAWLDKTFIDADMQQAHADAVKEENARKGFTANKKRTPWRNLLRWLRR